MGLLTADQRPQRQVVLERIGAADDKLAAAIADLVRPMVDKAELSAPSQLAVAEAMGALWRRAGCGEGPWQSPLRAAAAGREPAVAATARIQLGRCGDVTVLPDLQEDAATGSELLRAESCAALAGYARGPDQAKAHAALLERLADPSPVVQRAAVLALRRWPTPLPATALAALHARAPHLAYLLGTSDAEKMP